ncbi:Pre-rRNA-processing protein TSR2 [Babesia duncani]|nr:Pre-rRNA-processing protein TSR2 [Babesia duncani]
MALYYATRSSNAKIIGMKDVILLQITSATMVVFSSFNSFALLPAIFYLEAHKSIKTTHYNITRQEVKSILLHLIPSMIINVALIVFLGSTFGILSRPLEDVVSADYDGSTSSVDYSLFWYLQRLLPKEFMAGTLLKSHMMTFLYPIPLTLVLRKRPLDNVILMSIITILTQPNVSLVGIAYIFTLLCLRYPLLQRITFFTKMMVIITVLIAVSLGAYVSWIQRYMANPNHYFGPQIAITIAISVQLVEPDKRPQKGAPPVAKVELMNQCRLAKITMKMPSIGEIFEDSCRRILECWTALNLAAENNWGGENGMEKRKVLIQGVVDYCLSSKCPSASASLEEQVYADEIRDALVHDLEHEFHLLLDDDSETQVASEIARLHTACVKGDLDYVLALQQRLFKFSTSESKPLESPLEILEAHSQDASDAELLDNYTDRTDYAETENVRDQL